MQYDLEERLNNLSTLQHKSSALPRVDLSSTQWSGVPGCESVRSQQEQPLYPWLLQHFLLPPLVPVGLAMLRTAPPSPPPFPRYGHTAVVNATGDAFLFGGLGEEVLQKDVYCLSTRSSSATLLHTSGDFPSPRAGHASGIIGSVLIVWGGYTETKPDSAPGDEHDDGMYLLNLVSREWTRPLVHGPSPVGRHGHAALVVAPKFYVFGGQANGELFNDLWAFDFHSLRSKAVWKLIDPAADLPWPTKRTGHACVSYNGNIYLFGGTDRRCYYNDLWEFNTDTNEWTELPCLGFVPAPREGHAACVVGDVMYVFGGRGVDGNDLGDLAAFNISSKRWHMFRNMGPAPSARSGHAMVSAGSQIFVTGGSPVQRGEDPTAVYVLNTALIRYPAPAGRSSSDKRGSSVKADS